MAIINLNTGLPAEEEQVQQPTSVPAPIDAGGSGGRIINLTDGTFEQPDIQPQQVPVPVQDVQSTESPQPFTLGETLQGDLEVGLNLAVGTVGEIAGGLAGLFALPFKAEDAADTTKAVQDFFTREPKTRAGKQFTQQLGGAVESGVKLAKTPLAGVMAAVSLLTGEGAETAKKQFTRIQEEDLGKSLGDDLLELGVPPSISAVATAFPTAIAELIGFFGARTALRSSPENVQQIKQETKQQAAAIKADEASKATGVELFPAQRTLKPFDVETQSHLAELPESSAIAMEELGKQNAQVTNAVNDFMDTLASPESVSGAAPKFRDAAADAVDIQKTIRAEKASPIYKQAFRRQREGDTRLIDTKALEVKTSSMAAQFDPDGQVAKNLQTALKKIKVAGGDLQKLHNAKLEIDQIINGFGENAIGGTTKRFMTDVVTDLTDELKKQSPSYRAASAEFKASSPAVKEISDSIVGQVANLSDVQLKTAAKKIFDPAENATTIAKAKKAITAVSPDAWDNLLRAEIERRMGSVRADLGDLSSTSAIENIPSQLFNSIFGNAKSREVLFGAMNPTQKKNFKYLETVLRRGSAGRPGGSQTAIRTEIKRQLKGGTIQSIREFISSPTGKLASVGEDAAFNAKTKALATVMFDPSYSKELAAIMKLPPASSEAKRRMSLLLNSALIASPAVAEASAKQQEQ